MLEANANGRNMRWWKSAHDAMFVITTWWWFTLCTQTASVWKMLNMEAGKMASSMQRQDAWGTVHPSMRMERNNGRAIKGRCNGLGSGMISMHEQ